MKKKRTEHTKKRDVKHSEEERKQNEKKETKITAERQTEQGKKEKKKHIKLLYLVAVQGIHLSHQYHLTSYLCASVFVYVFFLCSIHHVFHFLQISINIRTQMSSEFVFVKQCMRMLFLSPFFVHFEKITNQKVKLQTEIKQLHATMNNNA